MAGPSMEPTYKEGDVLRTQAPKGDLQRGDVVVVADPSNAKRTLVKRIVALGGDTVELRKGELYVNGQAVAEPYANPTWKGDVAPVKVPAGQLYLLGDNRSMSFDSRNMGPVPVANVKAVAVKGN
jgi:signal peptidase I